MKDYELLELQAKAMRMVEGIDLFWKECVRVKNGPDSLWCAVYGRDNALEPNRYDYQLALAIVEGKPVFDGDELYMIDDKCIGYNSKFTASKDYHSIIMSPEKWSWNPLKPKTKTVTIELSYADATDIAKYGANCASIWVVQRACNEALK